MELHVAPQYDYSLLRSVGETYSSVLGRDPTS